MRRSNRRRFLVLGTSAAALVLLGAGGGKSPLAKKEPPLKVEETIGDVAYVRSAGDVRVEGVGLVIGLDGTGSDPGPGPSRTKLLNRMRQDQVPQAEQILASRTTSLVIVRAAIPVGITKEDVFDVEVVLPPESTTTSLAGGKLLLTELALVGVADGQVLEGKVLAKAVGPVLPGSAADPDDLRSGRVLGGARVREDVPYTLILKENRKGVRTSGLIEKVIGARFFRLEGVNQKGLAVAKTDEYLTLKVPKTYHQNQARYFQVVQLLPMVDAPELRARRLEQWGRELLDPATAGRAALKLEGLGPNAADVLRSGLASPDANVRYFAAEALAYLNDEAGVDVLAKAAVERPEFRAHAFAALASTDQAAAVSRLRDLMSHPDKEVRYGAFSALRALDEDDWALGKVAVLHAPAPPPDADDGDAMAFQIATARARRRHADPFTLYLVDCDGPPMIHVSNARRAEIVVFGNRQKLLPPVVLGGSGSVLLNAGLDDERIQVARIGVDTLDRPEAKVSCSLAVGDVIREAANLGASYPEIVSLLQAAERQRNLEGPLIVDALPAPSDTYDRAQLVGTDAKADAAVGRAGAEASRRRRGLGLLGRLRRDREAGPGGR